MDIYVGNLPYQADDESINELFSQYGTVNSARVITDRFSGDSKGFGFVDMPDKTEALAAISATNDVEFMGRKLRVNESQPKPRGDRRGGGGFRGDRRGGGGFRGDRGDRGGDRRW